MEMVNPLNLVGRELKETGGNSYDPQEENEEAAGTSSTGDQAVSGNKPQLLTEVDWKNDDDKAAEHLEKSKLKDLLQRTLTKREEDTVKDGSGLNPNRQTEQDQPGAFSEATSLEQLLHRGRKRHLSASELEKTSHASKAEENKNGGKGLTRISALFASDETYMCLECGKNFECKSLLRFHERLHDEDVSYKCEFCRRCFSSKLSLLTHQRLHLKEPPYDCLRCGICFKYKSNLAEHLRVHRGLKPYKCQDCDMSFSYFPDLRLHQKIHADGTEHRCTTCGITLGSQEELRVHEMLHQIKPPYKCPNCGEIFEDDSGLQEHKAMHGKESQ